MNDDIDDRTCDILNRMAEYEDIPEEEPTVIEVPNLAEGNERKNNDYHWLPGNR